MLRKSLLTVAALIGVIVLAALMIDEGETVVLITSDAEGRPHETMLWVVEVEGTPYLRGGREAGWLARLRREPNVELERAGHLGSWRASPAEDGAILRSVNEAMALKYGFADRMLHLFADPEASVPIRLDRAPDAETRSQR